MSWLDPRQWILVLLFVAAGIGGFKFWEHRIEARGYEKARAEYAVQAVKAAEKAAAQTAKMQKEKDDAEKRWSDRALEQRRDADRIRSERDRLRVDLRTTRGRLATAPVEAVRQYAATATDVFEQCAQRYSGVAQEADGHASDSLKLQEAWPTLLEEKP